TNKLTVEVTWRSGRRSVIRDLAPNQIIEIEESGAEPATAEPLPSPAPLFKDLQQVLAFTAEEEPFDDFARQPLLPKKLSRLGPGVAWVDRDGDGHDVLVIGASRAHPLAVFRNRPGANFVVWPGANFPPLPDDASGLAACPAASGKPGLLVGLANYES